MRTAILAGLAAITVGLSAAAWPAAQSGRAARPASGPTNARDLSGVWMPSHWYSTGRWEGDALVVDTVGLADTTLLNATGLPHSDQMTLTERIRKILGGDVLEVQFRVEDPVAYTKPWTATSYFKRDPQGQIIEYNCDLVVDYRQVER